MFRHLDRADGMFKINWADYSSWHANSGAVDREAEER
jgi:hypothetical protein